MTRRGAEVVLNGPSWTWFTPQGLNRVGTYREGVPVGRSVVWFPSGVRRRQGRFVAGQRHGEWREYHLNGTLAEVAQYERGELHGPRRRFFVGGRKSLEASYERAAPTGLWRAFYDQPEPNVAPGGIYRRGRETQRVEGFLPDGSSWLKTRPIRPCPQGGCNPALDGLDLQALPPLSPAPCAWGKGRDVPASQRARVARAALEAWPKRIADEPTLAPAGCVERITLSCAPDLDGEPGPEVLATIQYRIYLERCGAVPEGASEPDQSVAIVVLSASQPGSTAFTARGLVGYQAFSAVGLEGLALIDELQFVRLPNGEAALRTLETTDAGDCSFGRVDTLLMVRDGAVSKVTSRTLNECNGAVPPPPTWPICFPALERIGVAAQNGNKAGKNGGTL